MKLKNNYQKMVINIKKYDVIYRKWTCYIAWRIDFKSSW